MFPITLTLTLTDQEQLTRLAESAPWILNATDRWAHEATVTTVAPPAAAPPAAAPPAAAPPAAAPPAAAPPAAAAAITKDACVQAITKLATAHGRQAAVDVLSQFNASNLNDVSEGHWPALIEACDDYVVPF